MTAIFDPDAAPFRAAFLAWSGAGGAEVAKGYNPDQPRVPAGSPEGGEFGEGGGLGAAIDAYRAKYPDWENQPVAIPGLTPEQQAAVDALAQKTISSVGPGFKETDPALGRVILDQLDALQTRFPGVERLVVNTQSMVGWSGAKANPETTVAISTPGLIVFNDRFVGVSGDLRGNLDQPSGGFHPHGTDNLEGFVTHEFGHNVQDALSRLYNADPVAYKPLNRKNTSGILHQGGTILGSTNKGRFTARVGISKRVEIAT
jgi:hypothetical protein